MATATGAAMTSAAPITRLASIAAIPVKPLPNIRATAAVHNDRLCVGAAKKLQPSPGKHPGHVGEGADHKERRKDQRDHHIQCGAGDQQRTDRESEKRHGGESHRRADGMRKRKRHQRQPDSHHLRRAAARPQVIERKAQHQQKYRQEHIGGAGDDRAQQYRMQARSEA